MGPTSHKALERINSLLKQIGLPPAADLIGRKFFFASNGNKIFSPRVLVSTVGSVQLIEEQSLIIFPNPAYEPLFQLVSICWSTIDTKAIRVEDECFAMIWDGDPEEGEPFVHSLDGVFTLLD